MYFTQLSDVQHQRNDFVAKRLIGGKQRLFDRLMQMLNLVLLHGAPSLCEFKGMSDVIEVSMTETDHAHGKELMGQVCDQHGSDKNFPNWVPQPDRETLNRWPYCVAATRFSGNDAARGETIAVGLITRRDQQHEII